MKLDTSSYYPKSHLDDDKDDDLRTPELPELSESNPLPQTKPSEDAEKQDQSGAIDTESEWARAVTAGANLLSWIFVPLLMPVYGVLLAFNLSILAYASPVSKVVFTLIVAAFNVVAPAILFLLLKKFGLISDIGLNKRDERTLPYIICILCMIGTALFMWSKGAPLWLVMFFGGGAAAGVVEVLVNSRWKISAHAAGMAGIVALLVRILNSGYPSPSILTWIIIAVAISGLLGMARIWLGRHTPAQVLAGYAVGFCAVYFLSGI